MELLFPDVYVKINLINALFCIRTYLNSHLIILEGGYESVISFLIHGSLRLFSQLNGSIGFCKFCNHLYKLGKCTKVIVGEIPNINLVITVAIVT